jgi:hypothetical protein
MKKFLITAGFTFASLLTGCQEASTDSSSTSTSTTLTGVAALRSGSASALTFDSTVLATSSIDSNGQFQIQLPDGTEATFVRADSGDTRFYGLVPRDHHHQIVVDSASHAVLDSLRESDRDVRELSEELWDSLRINHEAADHHNDADSMQVQEHGMNHAGESDSTEIEHHGSDSISIPELDSISVPEPDSISVPKLDSISIPKLDSISVPKLDSISVPKLDSISIPELDSISVPEPDSLSVPKSVVHPIVDTAKIQ